MQDAANSLRLALLGNLCDNALIFRKFLQAAGFSTDVYMDRQEFATSSVPTVEALRSGNPAQRGAQSIHVWDEWSALVWLRRLPGGRHLYFVLCLLRFLWQVRRAQVIVSFGMYHIPGWLSRRPHLAFCTGADLHEVAVERSVRGWLMGRALQGAAYVASGLDPLSRNNAARLKLTGLHPFFIPWPIPSRPAAMDSRDGPVRVFMASRLDWCDGSRHGISKRNDLFIRAWARRVLEGWDSHFIIVEHGEDVEATRSLVADLGVEDRIEFVGRLSQRDLQRHVEAADLVADQFDQGTLGVLALQVLATGRALTIFVDPASNDCYGTPPPVLNGDNEEDLYNGLLSCTTRQELAELGRLGHAWMTREYGWQRLERLMRNVIEAAASRSSIPVPGGA
jgi:glycosyltransferase involved in cell wall biosynthesis